MGSPEDFERVYHPQAVNREAAAEPPATRQRGPAGLYATALWLRAAFSGLRWEVHQAVEHDDLVVLHVTMSGRHTGNSVTLPAGRRHRNRLYDRLDVRGEEGGLPMAADSELKGRHRKMWASGDYPSMVEMLLLPLGPALVEACGIAAGMRVLDVAAGTGNASIPAAKTGADVTASDLTPELLDAGRRRAEAEGVELTWAEADAENLPFEDQSFDVVMSSIGVMFAPRHQAAADELVRVCRPGGTIGMLNWTPQGQVGALFRTMGPFAPPPPPGAQPPPLWGSEEHVKELFGDRVGFRTLERRVLEITVFEHPRDYGEHFKEVYGPTIAAQANARSNGREAEFNEALGQFCDEWNRGTAEKARFEQEYLLAVGTRT